MLDGSADLTRLINSPVFSSEDQAKAIAAIADKAGITGLAGNFLRVVAQQPPPVRRARHDQGVPPDRRRSIAARSPPR